MKTTTLFILLCFIASFCVWFLPVPVNLAYSYDNLTIKHEWWTLITAQFVHGSLLHLGGNVLFMLLFGYTLEEMIGQSKFAVCFLVGGIFSFLLSGFFYPPGELMVGASGAICTLIAMVMLYNPWKLSLILVGFPMPLGVAGITYVLFNFWMATRPTDPDPNAMHVAYDAHIIGFVIGIVFSALWNPDWKKNLLISILLFAVFYAVLFFIIRHFAHS